MIQSKSPKNSEYVKILGNSEGKYGKKLQSRKYFWNLSNEENIQVLEFFKNYFFLDELEGWKLNFML